MAFPWAMLAQAANKYGKSQRGAREQYSFMEGGYADPKAVERGYEAGIVFSPHKAWSDPDVHGFDKFIAGAIPGIGGLISNLTGGGKRYRERKEKRMREYQEKAHAILGRTPGYEIPQETMEMLSMSEEGAGKVRELSGEAVELAKEATGQEKMPGYDIIKEDVLTGQAQSTQDVVEQGGVSALGSIAEIKNQSNEALKKLALENMKFRNRAASEYKDVLGRRAQAEMSAVGLETQALGEVARQKEQQFQIEVLDPHYAKLQWDIIQTGNQMAGAGAQEGAGTGAAEGIGTGIGSLFQGGGAS